MNPETNAHVERRPGQRWRSSRPLNGKPYVIEGTLAIRHDFGGTLGICWHIVNATLNGVPKPDGEYVFYGGNWTDARGTMTLLADVPTAPKVECKAPEWCGKKYGAAGVPYRRSCGFPMYFAHGNDFNVAVKDDEQTWCSLECRDRVPPLESKPAETGKCCRVVNGSRPCSLEAGHPGNLHISFSKAPTVPEAPKASGPVCVGYGASSAHECRGPTLARVVGAIRGSMCEAWMFRLESTVTRATSSSGEPYAGPERLDRPTMAHVANAHDDDLVTW